MNKGELVDAIAIKADITKKEADAILSAAIETIVETVASGEKITLVGFGSLRNAIVKREKVVIPRRARR